MSASHLTAGRFYSGVVARAHRPEFVLSELNQATPQKFPTHHHERDYFFLVLAGDYREGTSRKEHAFAPISAGYNPKHVEHAGEAGRKGVRFFTMEFSDDFVRSHSRPLPRDPVVDYGARDIVWSGLRLFQCFRQSAAPDPLSFESLACELLGAAHGREDYLGDTPPSWLHRAIARLEAAIATGCSIAGLARDVGVHPVHLARVFRKTTGISPGEYLQRLRADRACNLLLNSTLPLSEVAADCGFYDQSHMTRLLRRYAHTTPKAIRALHRKV